MNDYVEAVKEVTCEILDLVLEEEAGSEIVPEGEILTALSCTDVSLFIRILFRNVKTHF